MVLVVVVLRTNGDVTGIAETKNSFHGVDRWKEFFVGERDSTGEGLWGQISYTWTIRSWGSSCSRRCR